MKELITSRRYDSSDDLVNDLTREMDKHLLPGMLCKEYGGVTYLCYGNYPDHYAIRFPGATRGHIVIDKNSVITEIALYDTASENCVKCYHPSVHETVKEFVGAKIIFAKGKEKS